MLKERLLPISLFSLAFAIIISAFIISASLRGNRDIVVHGLGNDSNSYNYNQEITKDNFDLSEAAEYLHISQSQLLKLATPDGSGMPYIKIDGIYIFNRNAINKWLEIAQIEIY